MKLFTIRRLVVLLALAAALVPLTASAKGGSYLGRFNTIDVVSSTVPGNGDVNPYGTFVVPSTVGMLTQGNILISNFNNGSNLQGTGTTIVQITPGGSMTLFAQIDPSSLPGPCPGGVGLTTALVVLRKGWVIVGSLPTTDGMADTAQAGCLLVLNSNGQVVETFSGGRINGPWDMTALDDGDSAQLFVSNVMNGTVAGGGNIVHRGTVLRINLGLPGSQMPRALSRTVIGSGFAERTDPSALVIGPTGLALDEDGTLYVADTLANRIAKIPNATERMSSAGRGMTVSRGGAINTPLGLTLAPNGDLIDANGGDGNLVEVTPGGNQVATKTVEPAGAGSLFGLAIVPQGQGVYYVDDATNALNILH